MVSTKDIVIMRRNDNQWYLIFQGFHHFCGRGAVFLGFWGGVTRLRVPVVPLSSLAMSPEAGWRSTKLSAEPVWDGLASIVVPVVRVELVEETRLSGSWPVDVAEALCTGDEAIGISSIGCALFESPATPLCMVDDASSCSGEG